MASVLVRLNVVGGDGERAANSLDEEGGDVGGEEYDGDSAGGDEEMVYAVKVACQATQEDVV